MPRAEGQGQGAPADEARESARTQAEAQAQAEAGAGEAEGVVEGAQDADRGRDMQQQSKALDSITDHVEERQLDSRRVQQAMASIAASQQEARHAQSIREKELATVRISATHVHIIAAELEVDKKLAEQRLREHKGDAVGALRSFLQ